MKGSRWIRLARRRGVWHIEIGRGVSMCHFINRDGRKVERSQRVEPWPRGRVCRCCMRHLARQTFAQFIEETSP